MKRLFTLATTGLFATGLAVLPATVFAQPAATAGTDAKPGTSSHSVTGDAKVAPVHKDAGATKDATKDAMKDATKDATATKDPAKVGAPKPGAAPAGAAAKTMGNHDKGA
jgi:hypothetical protein